MFARQRGSTKPETSPMTTIPVLPTDRLVLRPFREDDAPAVDRMLATPHIAEHTLSFSHPSPPGAALAWVRRRLEWAEQGINPQWAITLPGDQLIGAVGILLHDNQPAGSIGYWIGPEFWNRGYATEAARAVIRYGFDTLRLRRLEAMCFVDNLPSARVLEKAGMRFEERRDAHVLKDGLSRDVLVYGIARQEWTGGEA
jgi:RimJ/RimL family protein N-acetyltransferase